MISKATDIVRIFMAELVRPGDFVVDATCGNGHDTLMLARCVGESGFVLGIDIQPEAITATRQRSRRSACNIELMLADHADLGDILKNHERGAPRAVVFNLGYLPGSDKRLVTTAEKTISALRHALQYVQVSGWVAVVVYTAHKGAEREALEIDRFIAELDVKQYAVLKHEWINLPGNPPYVIMFERRA